MSDSDKTEDLWEIVLANGQKDTETEEAAAAMIRVLTAHLAERNVTESPIVKICGIAVVVAGLAVRCLVLKIWSPAPSQNGETRCPADSRDPDKSDLEALGKATERLVKAMEKLEEVCEKAGTPINLGIADLMKPVLKKAEGVLNEALGASTPKRRRARRESGSQTTTEA